MWIDQVIIGKTYGWKDTHQRMGMSDRERTRDYDDSRWILHGKT